MHADRVFPVSLSAVIIRPNVLLMILLTTKSEMLAFQKNAKLDAKTIGFVPTMGALHEGHLELVKRAKHENDVVICSIFVNPTQFDNAEDLKKYPRTVDADCELLKSVHCDAVFVPTPEEMYPQLPALSFDFGNLEHVMEGKYRKGHFNGVGIVVAKLFHLVAPHKAYFGKKDLQQVAVIKRLVDDLSFDIEIIPCETVREEDGLAKSSRNRRLSPQGRKVAFHVNLSLQVAKEALLMGKPAVEAKNEVDKHFASLPEFSLEYLEIVDFETFESIQAYDPARKTAICTANYLEDVRLIDNIVF